MPTGTRNCSVRFSLPGHGQIRISLKTPDKDKATVLAHRTYWEAVNRTESDQSVRNKMTDLLIRDWLNLPRLGVPYQKISTRLLIMNRYFGGFIGNQPITDKTMTAYQIWRNDYWITGSDKGSFWNTSAKDQHTAGLSRHILSVHPSLFSCEKPLGLPSKHMSRQRGAGDRFKLKFSYKN